MKKKIPSTGRVASTRHSLLMIIKYADQKKAIIISNDKFREILEAHPEWEDQILNRTLQFTWAIDTFMVASDPFGRNGPSLDQILHH